MLKLIKPAQEAQHQVFCDATGEQLSWCALFNDYYHSPESKICPVVGCEIKFNTNYGAIMDSLDPVEIHLSEEVTLEFIKWLREKYPQSPFIQELLQKEYFNDMGRLSIATVVS